jgi:hypothetical protein
VNLYALPSGCVVRVEPSDGLLVLRVYVDAEHYVESPCDLVFGGGVLAARACVLLALDAHRMHRQSTPIAQAAREARRKVLEHLATAPADARDHVRSRAKGKTR